MVFGLKRGSRENGGSFFSRHGRSSASVASTTDAASVSYQNTGTASSLNADSVAKTEEQATSKTWAGPEQAKPQEAKPEEKIAETPDVLGSSLNSELLGDVFRSELDDKKIEGINAVDNAEETHLSIANEISAGQRTLDNEKAGLAKSVGREDEALRLLNEHQECLNGLKKSLETQATASREKVVRDNTTSKRLEIELAAAEEAVTAGRAKADDARLKRAQNVATNTAAVAEADDRVVTIKAQMAGVTERHRTTEASVALMKARIVEVFESMAACEREKDFALEAMEALGKDNEAAEQTTQKASDMSASSSSSLKAHVEDSERRVLGHEAELRRCQNRLQAAEKLRDLRSRPALHDGDSASLEKARSNAKSAADQSAVALASEQQALKATKDADEARKLELTAAATKASLNLSQRDVAGQAIASRFADRKKAGFNARALHTAAITVHDTVSQELELNEKRAAELQEAKAACALKVEETIRQAADALHKLSAEEMPLKHTAQAEVIVMHSREQERANIRLALEVARLGAKEAGADALQLSATDVDVAAVTVDHGMVISEMEVRLQEKELVVKQARIAREGAEKALADAQAELKTAEEAAMPGSFKEAAMPSSFEAIPASDGLEDPDGEDQRKLSGLLSQEAQMRKTLAIASFDNHKSTLHAAQVEEEMGTSALVSVSAELERAQASAAAQSSAVKQMMTADLLQVEISDVARCHQQHTDSVAHLQSDENKASDKWGAKRESLKADLHRAEMALRLAKEDLTHTDGVREMFKE